MTHFSFAQVLKGALTGQKNWTPQWPDAQPKAAYDVVIVGAGGHGLGDRLLPGEGARHHQRRGDRQGLARRRQHRPQHHDHPLELPLRRERRLYDHALDLWEDLSPGAELQRHVLASAA